MWGPDNKIYFISDRDNRMNLYSIDLTSKETKQLTNFKDFDIKFPSIGKDAIVFEQAGYIWRYDLASGQADADPDSSERGFRLRPRRAGRRCEADRSRVKLGAGWRSASSRSRAASFSPCRPRMERRAT